PTPTWATFAAAVPRSGDDARSLHGTQPSCSRAARAKIACSAPSTGTVGSKRTISGHTRAKKLVFLDSVSMLLPSDKVPPPPGTVPTLVRAMLSKARVLLGMAKLAATHCARVDVAAPAARLRRPISWSSLHGRRVNRTG